MDIERWIDTWSFLSLDLCEDFSAELLLPRNFGTDKRLALQQMIDEELVLREPEAGVFTIFQQLDPTFLGLAEELFLWGQYIYIDGGNERTAELFWNLAPHLFERGKPFGSSWVATFLNRLRIAVDDFGASSKERLASLSAEKLSDRDRKTAIAVFGTDDCILSSLKNIINCNELLVAWRTASGKLTVDELNELYEIGNQLGLANNFPRPIAYPGSWRPVTERFAAAWTLEI